LRKPHWKVGDQIGRMTTHVMCEPELGYVFMNPALKRDKPLHCEGVFFDKIVEYILGRKIPPKDGEDKGKRIPRFQLRFNDEMGATPLLDDLLGGLQNRFWEHADAPRPIVRHHVGLFMTTAQSRTALHKDPWPSVVVQLRGSKRVQLVKRPTSLLFDKAFGQGSQLTEKQVNTYLEDGANVGDVHPPVKECWIHEGETLYMPEGTFHDIWYETNNANLVIRLEGSDDAAADALAISAKEGKKKKAKG